MLVAALLAAAAVASVATYAFGYGSPDFTPTAAGIHYDLQAPNRLILFSRGAGTAASYDDTTLIYPNNGAPPTHASGWEAIDVTGFGVPVTAKAVYLSFLAATTKGLNDGTATVFGFVRAPGAVCCDGPPNYPNYPIDWNAEDGFVSQTANQLARDANRTWSQATVPLVNGKFEFAWGYRKIEGNYPDGDAVGIAVYINGWLD